jgi:hypothetical protein
VSLFAWLVAVRGVPDGGEVVDGNVSDSADDVCDGADNMSDDVDVEEKFVAILLTSPGTRPW